MAGLAVADAFTVESYYKGVCYSYVVSLQDGIPVTLHLGDVTTSEPDGLKLGVTVESSKLHYYKEKANNLYKYFDYKPNINDSSVVMELDTAERISDNWFIQETTDRYDYDNYIVMSQVVYKIPRDSSINTHNFRRLVIKAEPGSVTFNPGRESLSLDKKTVEYVNQAFEQVKTDYVTASTTAMAACESDKELRECFYNVIKSAPNEVARSIIPKPFMSQELQQITNLGYGSTYNIYETEEFRNDTNDLLRLSQKVSYYKTARALDGRNTISWQQFFEAIHVIVDLKTKYKQAINSYYDNKNVILWQRQQGADLDEAVEEAKRYLKSMGLSYKLASEILADNPVIENTLLPREGLYVSSVDRRNKQVYKSTAMDEETTKKEKYLYLKLKNTTPELQDSSFSFGDYMTLYNLLEKVLPEGTLPMIRGVAKKYQGYVEKLDNWLDFETYIKDNIRKQTFKCVVDPTVSTKISRQVTAENIKEFPKSIQNYYQNVLDYEEYCGSTNYIQNATKTLVEKVGASIEKFSPEHLITKEQIKEKFPLASKELLENNNLYHTHYSTKELIYLARLEEFYALHPTEQ